MPWTVSKHVGYLIELVCMVNSSAHARRGSVSLQKVDFLSLPPENSLIARPIAIPYCSNVVQFEQ